MPQYTQLTFSLNCMQNFTIVFHALFTPRSYVTDQRKLARFVHHHNVDSKGMQPETTNNKESKLWKFHFMRRIN
uniref:CSON010829 protein n=1 Tax=Culicoides sonorensis TaxID=179676 RepID=A0A336M681_CULSO